MCYVLIVIAIFIGVLCRVRLTNRCSSRRRYRIQDRVQSGRSADLVADSAPLLNSMLFCQGSRVKRNNGGMPIICFLSTIMRIRRRQFQTAKAIRIYRHGWCYVTFRLGRLSEAIFRVLPCVESPILRGASADSVYISFSKRRDFLLGGSPIVDNGAGVNYDPSAFDC